MVASSGFHRLLISFMMRMMGRRMFLVTGRAVWTCGFQPVGAVAGWTSRSSDGDELIESPAEPTMSRAQQDGPD